MKLRVQTNQTRSILLIINCLDTNAIHAAWDLHLARLYVDNAL